MDTFQMTVEEILAQFSTMVYRLAYARTKNQSDAEDVTQEVFMKYMEHREEFASAEHIKAWLIRVTVNISKNVVTSAWNQRTTGMEEWEVEGYQMPEKSDVYYAVMELPEDYRQLIHLFYYEQLSIEQIANSLQMKKATVKTRLRRARQRLKEILDNKKG